MKKRIVSIIILFSMLINTGAYAKEVIDFKEGSQQKIVESEEYEKTKISDETENEEESKEEDTISNEKETDEEVNKKEDATLDEEKTVEDIEEIENEKNLLKEEISKILKELEELIKEINANEISENYNTNKKSRSLKLTDDEEKLNALKKQLDKDLSLEELENLKEEVTLFKTDVVKKLNDLDSKNSDSIVYIVTDQDETSTKEKYESEFGDVIVTKNILSIVEDKKDGKFLEESKGKDLTIIVEKDLSTTDTINIPKDLNSLNIEGRKDGETGKNPSFKNILKLYSVPTNVKNLGVNNREGSVIGAGPGNSTELKIENSIINSVWGVDYNIKDEKKSGNSSVNVSIKDSNIFEYLSVASVTMNTIDVVYDINFKSENTNYGWHLGPGVDFMLRSGNDNQEITYNVGDINVDIKNDDNSKVNIGSDMIGAYTGLYGVFIEHGNSFKNIKLNTGDINIKLDGINVEKAYTTLVESSHVSMDANIKDVKIDINNSKLGQFYNQKLQTTVGDKDLVTIENYDLNVTNSKIDQNYLMGMSFNRDKNYEKIGFDIKNVANINYDNVTSNGMFLGFNGYNYYKKNPNFSPEDITQKNNINFTMKDSNINTIEGGRNSQINSDIEFRFINSNIENLIINTMTQIPKNDDSGKSDYGFLETSGNKIVIFENDEEQRINSFYGSTEVHLKNPLMIEGTPYYNENSKVTLIEPENWKVGDIVIASNPKNKINGNEFVQSWPVFPERTDDANAKPPYIMEYFTPAQVGSHAWILGADVLLHGNGGKFLDNHDYKHLKVFSDNTSIGDYHDKDDINNNIIPVHPDGLEFLGWTIAEDGNLEEDENNRTDFNEETIFTKNLHLYAKWKEKEVETKNYTVVFNSNGGTNIPNQKINKGEKVTEPKDPTRDGYKFLGWYEDKDLTNKFNFNTELDKDIILYAKWEKESSGGNGGSNRPHKKPNKDKKDDEKEVVVRPQIESTLFHKAYLFGYEDGTIRPKESITREEASAVLDRVTENKPMTKMIYNYKDVEQNRWSYNNINNLSNKGGIKGYPDGEFKPLNRITRAEAATILVRLENATGSNTNIPEEIKDHWANKDLVIAIEKGWIKGYEDGSIKPDAFITRAEFVTMVNRMQNRKVSSNKIEEEIVPSIESYKDLDKNAWYYEDILEATNTHNYREERLEDGSEDWTSIIK